MNCSNRPICDEKWCKNKNNNNIKKKKKIDFNLKTILRSDTIIKTEPWHENYCRIGINACNKLLSFYEIIKHLQDEIAIMKIKVLQYELEIEELKPSENKQLIFFRKEISKKRRLRNKYVNIVKHNFNEELIKKHLN